MKPERCPSCGATDLVADRLDRWRCSACGTLSWVEDGEVHGVAPPRRSPWPRLAVGAIVLAAVALGLTWIGRTATPDTAPAPPSKQLDRRPSAEPPEISSPYQRRGTTPDGTPFWLVTYRNVDGVPVGRPGLRLTLYDPDGHVLESVDAAGPFEELLPGDEAILLVRSPRADFARAVVTPSPPFQSRREPQTFRLYPKELTEVTTRRGPTVSGDVTNTRDVPVMLRDVIVVGRDRDGIPTAWASGPAETERLDPGEETAFEVVAGTYVVQPTAYWTAYVFAAPAED